jgi:hypothetical protein
MAPSAGVRGVPIAGGGLGHFAAFGRLNGTATVSDAKDYLSKSAPGDPQELVRIDSLATGVGIDPWLSTALSAWR